MKKEELRQILTAKTEEYSKPIYTYAESVDQEKRLKRRCETRKKPVNLAAEYFENYLRELKEGKVQEHQPSYGIWEVPMERFEVQYKEKGSTTLKRWSCDALSADNAIDDFRHWYKTNHPGVARIITSVKIRDAK